MEPLLSSVFDTAISGPLVPTSYASELWVCGSHTRYVEERQKGLVGYGSNKEFGGVRGIEDSFEFIENGGEDGSTGNVSDAIETRVAENIILMPIGQRMCLRKESRRKSSSKSCVVYGIDVHVVVYIPHVFQRRGPAAQVRGKKVKESRTLRLHLLELWRVVECSCVGIKSAAILKSFESHVVVGIDAMNWHVLITI